MIDTTPSGIRALLAAGEGNQVEFKQFPPASSIIERYTELFARLDGGIMLVGVGVQGDVRGISLEQASLFFSKARRVALRMGNQTRIGTGTVELDGKTVAFLEVFPRGDKSALAEAQAKKQRDKVRQFFVELVLSIIVIACAWWYIARNSKLGGGLPPFNFPTVSMILTGMASLLGLIFYGTSFEITPFKLISPPITPILRLLGTLEPLKRSSGTEENHNEEVAKAQGTPASTADERISADVAEEEPEQVSPIHDSVSDSASAAETVDELEPEDLINEVAERATFFANKLEKRTDTYMILGVVFGALGLLVWAWKLSAISSPVTLGSFAQVLLPRMTILAFIELLAGFFLRQYRIGIEDFKHFFDIEQRARWKGVAYAIAKKTQEKSLLKQVALSLSDNLTAPTLRRGETTSTLEAMKTESNPTLEALKLVTETAKDAIGKFGKSR